MICPKCGAEISDSANRCGNCGLKVNIRCPECRTVNTFGVKYCKNCGFDFLITCPVCGSTNIYLAKECRKCHSKLEKPQKKKPEQKPKIKIKEDVEVVSSFSSDVNNYVYFKAENKETDNKTEELQQPTKAENEGMPFVEDNQQDEITPPAQENKQFFSPENIQNTTETKHSDNTPSAEPQIPEAEPLETVREEQKELEIKPNKKVKRTVKKKISSKPEKKEEVKKDIKKQDSLLLEEDDDEKAFEEIFNQTETEELKEIQEDVSEEKSYQKIEAQQINLQTKAVEKAVEIITKSLNKHIIAINGPEGCGKTAVNVLQHAVVQPMPIAEFKCICAGSIDSIFTPVELKPFKLQVSDIFRMRSCA